MRKVATIGFALGIAWLGTACTLDMNVGEWLKPQPGGNGSGSSGSSGSGNAGENSGPPATAECIDAEQGGDTSCKDVGTWKQYAYDACQSSGLTLGDYIPHEGCGEGLFRYVSYSCCKANPPPPPPPTPTPSSCIDAKQGGDTSCKDAGTWKQYAYDACQSSGLTLGAYLPQEECGEGLYRYVSYSCCKVDSPPPLPPTKCVDQEQGGATSCKDVATWKHYASQACESSGSSLGDYFPREQCGEGLFRYVDYTCCPKVAPPPPPPPPKDCVVQKQGSNTSCKDTGTWKTYAGEACESSGLNLTNYTPEEACGKDAFRYVNYTCCPR